MSIPSNCPSVRPHHCPVCDERVRMTPAHLEEMAPCPHCGALLNHVVRDSEVDFNLLSRSHETTLWTQLAFDSLETGFRVRVTNGPFSGMAGAVDQLDTDNKSVLVTLEFFGRPTLVELELRQVERTSDS